MQGTLVVPGRRLQGRRMGQFFYQTPEAKPKKDVERTYSAEELTRGLSELKTAEEALNFYKAILFNHSIRTKVAFLADLWKKIKASPEMTGALAAKEEGRAWLDIFWKSESAFLSYTQPNLFINISRMTTILETAILPRFGIAVKGRLAIYAQGATELSYADTRTNVPNAKQTYDFGDLSKTTFGEDAKSLEAAMKAIDPTYRLGIADWVIALIVVLSAIVLTYGIYKFTTPPEIPPEVKDILAKLKDVDPKAAGDLLKQWMSAASIFGGLTEALKWLAIGAGVITVGGIAFYFVTK